MFEDKIKKETKEFKRGRPPEIKIEPKKINIEGFISNHQAIKKSGSRQVYIVNSFKVAARREKIFMATIPEWRSYYQYFIKSGKLKTGDK